MHHTTENDMTEKEKTTDASKAELSEDELDSVQGGFVIKTGKHDVTSLKDFEILDGSKTLKT